MSISMRECRITPCWNCKETRFEEVLICAGNDKPCFQDCYYYDSHLNPFIRLIARLFSKRIPRPDCEQAEYRTMCIECGEVRETKDSSLRP